MDPVISANLKQKDRAASSPLASGRWVIIIPWISSPSVSLLPQCQKLRYSRIIVTLHYPRYLTALFTLLVLDVDPARVGSALNWVGWD